MSIDNDLQTLWETVQSLKAYPESEMIGRLIESVLLDQTFSADEVSEFVRLKNENLLLRKEVEGLKTRIKSLFEFSHELHVIVGNQPGNSINARLMELMAKERNLQSLAESSQN